MWDESSDDRIRRLQDELYDARSAVLRLLPPTIQDVADDYYRIESRRDAAEWLERVVEAAIELAWSYAEEHPYSGPRAYCPLCKRGTSSYMREEGFLLPDGMRKHLLGEGNAHECEVILQVRKLAASYWRPRVEEAEALARVDEEADLARRRLSEEQFRVGPSDRPYLRDEMSASNGVRDNESLAWAIDRLSQLGFREGRENLIRQFTKEYEHIVVYADPRPRGRIEFAVYRREQVEKPKSRRRWSPHHAGFHLLDTWKNNVLPKFETRVQHAERSLRKSTAAS